MMGRTCANQIKIVQAPLKITCGADGNLEGLSPRPKVTNEPTRRSVLNNLRLFSIGITAFALAEVFPVGSASADCPAGCKESKNADDKPCPDAPNDANCAAQGEAGGGHGRKGP